MYKMIVPVLLCGFLLLFGCSGVQTFPSMARAGDTAVIAAGWKHDFSRDNISVIITPSYGAPIIYPAGDPAVRAVINLYPDPLASLLVSEATNQNLTPYAQTYALAINNLTKGDRDWWQTTVYVDLPPGLPLGSTNIEVSNTAGDSVSSIVEIIEGAGNAELFDAEINGPLTSVQLHSMERVGHYVITFSGSTIPYAIQLNMSHDPDVTIGGAGKTFVSNPRGDLKNVLWKDNGSDLIVLLTPVQLQSLNSLKDFKFYVAGNITGLQIDQVTAVDISGNPVTDVTVDIVVY